MDNPPEIYTELFAADASNDLNEHHCHSCLECRECFYPASCLMLSCFTAFWTIDVHDEQTPKIIWITLKVICLAPFYALASVIVYFVFFAFSRYFSSVI